MTQRFPGDTPEEKPVDVAPQPVAKPQSDSSYPFSDEHSTEWNLAGSTYSQDSPIARAWARLYDRGIQVGPPTSDEYHVQEGITLQRFQLAKASLDTTQDMQKSYIVVFSDARGIVGTESGI